LGFSEATLFVGRSVYKVTLWVGLGAAHSRAKLTALTQFANPNAVEAVLVLNRIVQRGVKLKALTYS
jgi:hypothetical protein